MKYLKKFENYSVNEIFGLSKAEKAKKAQERVDQYLVKSDFLADHEMNKELGKEGIEEIANMYPDLFKEHLFFEARPMLTKLPDAKSLEKYKTKKWYEYAIDRIEEVKREYEKKQKSIVPPKPTNRGDYLNHGSYGMDPDEYKNW